MANPPVIQPTVVEPVCVTVPQAAAMLGIGKSRMWELVGRGEVESFKLGGARRIRVAALRRYVDTLASADPE